MLSSSPPQSGRQSPPLPTTPSPSVQEPVELQIDYWPIARPQDTKEKNQAKGSDQGKNSIKSTFRNLQVKYFSNVNVYNCKIIYSLFCICTQVYRLPLFPQSGEMSHGLTLNYATKEKKQKSEYISKYKCSIILVYFIILFLTFMIFFGDMINQ